jgi:integrase
MAGVRELVKEGQATANGVIKKATQTVYESRFKKFAEFCLANGYPYPHTERHHELPAVLVAYLQSISASSTVSLQTAEKARSAVASYYNSHESSDGTDVNKWSVVEDESGTKYGYGNLARDTFVRQFMRGLKKKKATEYVPARAVPVSLQMVGVLHTFLDSPCATEGFTKECRMWFKAVSSFAFYGMCRINEVLTLKRRDVSLRQFRPNVVIPDAMIEFGTYALFNRKIEVAEGRSYNLHNLAEEETPINQALVQLGGVCVEGKGSRVERR